MSEKTANLIVPKEVQAFARRQPAFQVTTLAQGELKRKH